MSLTVYKVFFVMTAIYDKLLLLPTDSYTVSFTVISFHSIPFLAITANLEMSFISKFFFF